MSLRTKQAGVVWVLSLALTNGCSSGPDLARVWGEVTFDGERVEDGTIEFTPIDGTGGGLVGSAITAGAYEVPRHHGARVGGAYKVAIVSVKETGRKILDMTGPKGETLFEFTNFIPARYSTATELKVTISADEEQNHFDFRLRKGAG